MFITVYYVIFNFQYPKEIAELAYKPGFAIRGLHYDIEKGLLMKLDSFLQIQLGTVYRGLTSVSDEEVLSLYKNKTIPLSYVETQGKNAQVNFKFSTMTFFNPIASMIIPFNYIFMFQIFSLFPIKNLFSALKVAYIVANVCVC